MIAPARGLTLVVVGTLLVTSTIVGPARAAQASTLAAAVNVATSRFPEGITAGPDGALWFTEKAGNAIGRITVNGKVTEYALHQKIDPAVGGPQCIVNGPGGLWFTDYTNRVTSPTSIGRITPQGKVTLFPLAQAVPDCLARGHDGNLWFTSSIGIGRMTPTGQTTLFPLPQGRMPTPYGITAGPDGALWFSDFQGTVVGRITTTGSYTLFPIPGIKTNVMNSTTITPGPDGDLWFTSFAGGRIGRVSPAGKITIFAVPSNAATAGPDAITAGPGGALWFTELYIGAIGRITVNGKVTQYPMPDPALSGSHGIVLGPDHNLWFTVEASNAIVRLNPSTGALTTFLLTPRPTS